MRCPVHPAFGLAVVLAVCPALARAQHHAAQPPGFHQGLTPNSTFEGDTARFNGLGAIMSAQSMGFGSALNALGMYNLCQAQANQIDSATTMAWMDYYKQSMREECAQSLANRAARRKHQIELYNRRKERIANNPNELDLLGGDALNALLEQLSNPKIEPSALKKAGESIPGETIQRIALKYASKGLTISLGRLTVRDGWPPALRDDRFAPERKGYLDAVQATLERNLARKLTPEDFKSLQAAVLALKRKLKATIPESDSLDFVQAKAFIEDLDDAIAPLKDVDAQTVLCGLDRYAGTTVGDVVVFMQRYNLRFAMALSREERESYRLLYATMVRRRDQITPLMPGFGRNNQPPAVVVPADRDRRPPDSKAPIREEK
jgi:hypothetical protein